MGFPVCTALVEFPQTASGSSAVVPGRTGRALAMGSPLGRSQMRDADFVCPVCRGQMPAPTYRNLSSRPQDTAGKSRGRRRRQSKPKPTVSSAGRRCRVIDCAKVYGASESLAQQLGVGNEWKHGNRPQMGEEGTVVAQCVRHSIVKLDTDDDPSCVAVRMDGDGRVVLIKASGISYEVGAVPVVGALEWARPAQVGERVRLPDGGCGLVVGGSHGFFEVRLDGRSGAAALLKRRATELTVLQALASPGTSAPAAPPKRIDAATYTRHNDATLGTHHIGALRRPPVRALCTPRLPCARAQCPADARLSLNPPIPAPRLVPPRRRHVVRRRNLSH